MYRQAQERAVADLVRFHDDEFRRIVKFELAAELYDETPKAWRGEVSTRAARRAKRRLRRAYPEEFKRLLHAHHHQLNLLHLHDSRDHVHVEQMPAITVGRRV